MLCNNWATIRENSSGGVTIYFVNEDGDIFDKLNYKSIDEGIKKLEENGFDMVFPDSSPWYTTPNIPYARFPGRVRFEDGVCTHRPVYSSGEFGHW